MTLQEQYNSIKNGKGNKAQFLKQARSLFPEYFNQYTDFDTATNVLKSKQIISEAAGGVVAKGFDIFDWKKILAEETENLPKKGDKYENVEVKIDNDGTIAKKNVTVVSVYPKDKSVIVRTDDGGDAIVSFEDLTKSKTISESVKAVEKETSKEVLDDQKNNYNNKDMKNADNVNFNEIMKGFYTELKDEKNNGKTGDELKAIVVKNLAKDPLYYTKNGEFGIKGVGYTTEAPGLGEPKEPKGKHKSSGYGDLKESVMYGDSDGDFDEQESNKERAYWYYDAYLFEKDPKKKDEYLKLARKYGSYLGWGEQELPPVNESLEEQKLRSLIRNLIKEELNEGSIEINGKTVKTYTQNGDKSYNVTYDDGTKDKITMSNDAWNEINILHRNATKN